MKSISIEKQSLLQDVRQVKGVGSNPDDATLVQIKKTPTVVALP